ELQAAVERPDPAVERLAQLAQHLRPADLAEVDAPLGVVVGGGAVEVAGVDVADLVRGIRGRAHEARHANAPATIWTFGWYLIGVRPPPCADDDDAQAVPCPHRRRGDRAPGGLRPAAGLHGP